MQVGDGEPERIGLALVCNTTPWTYLGRAAGAAVPRRVLRHRARPVRLRRLRTVATLRHLRQILSREPRCAGATCCSCTTSTSFVLRADRPLAFQVDGDDLGDRTEVVFRAVPRALDVVV